MRAVEYISDTEEIIKASWSNFRHDGVAAFSLSEWSPLPPGLSATGLPAGWTQVSHIPWIRRIRHHPGESDKDWAPESISNTENWLNCNSHFNNQNESEDDCKADDESDIKPCNGTKAGQSPEHRVWVLHQMFLDWFSQHGGQWIRLNSGWWLSLELKQGGIRENRKSQTKWVNMFSQGSICCLTKNFT